MTKEITISDGRNVKIKDGKGKDLLNAQKVAKSTDEITYALLAELCEFDGQKLVFEDILELPITDVINLQTAVSGKLQLSQPNA